MDVLGTQNLYDFVREMQGYVIDLLDGDVLYIPPYWFHSVVTVETTLSLNIWSQSESFLTMEQIYKVAIPFEAEWGRPKLMKCLCYFITLLTEQILGISGSSSEFVLDRVYSRYETLLEKGISAEFRTLASELKEFVQDYCLKEKIPNLLDTDAMKHLETGAMDIATQFLDIHPSSVREVNLANYIEHLVWRMLGQEDLRQLPFYLHECFKP